jgi:hypothetical protein
MVYSTAMTLILIAALLAASESRITRSIGFMAAAPALVTMWVAYVFKSPEWLLANEIFVSMFLVYVIFLLLRFVLKARDVNMHLVFAAVSVYLVIGIFWSFLFSLLEFLEPGSFEGILETESGHPQAFLYFSFVTLTTLGYGDITPANAKAGSLAMTEAIIGQIYMAVLVAWLVGLNVSRRAGGTECEERKKEAPDDFVD